MEAARAQAGDLDQGRETLVRVRRDQEEAVRATRAQSGGPGRARRAAAAGTIATRRAAGRAGGRHAAAGDPRGRDRSRAAARRALAAAGGPGHRAGGHHWRHLMRIKGARFGSTVRRDPPLPGAPAGGASGAAVAWAATGPALPTGAA